MISFEWFLKGNWNLPGATHMPAHKRILKKLPLGQNPELKWETSEDDRNIQRGKMVHRVDAGLVDVNFLQSLHVDTRAYRSEDHAGPKSGKPMLNAAIAIKKR